MHQKPTEAELEILQILWQHGPSTVRFVNEKLNEKKESDQKETGYTTTLKLMQIMTEKKGLTSRNTDSRTHIYAAKVSEIDTQAQLLQQFVQATFRGSASKLVMQALGNHNASQKELDEIRALLDHIEKQND